MEKGGGALTLLHAAHVAELGLVLAVLAGAGADLQTVLLTDGARAALQRGGRGRHGGENRSIDGYSRVILSMRHTVGGRSGGTKTCSQQGYVECTGLRGSPAPDKLGR